MDSHPICRTGLAALLIALSASATQADNPSRADIVKQGKAATAFLRIPSTRSSGTAFCVHPSGLFVTNEHVIRAGAAAKIHLVLDSGLKTERVLEAKVVRADRALDLALLRVEGVKALPSLALATADDPTELTEVIIFGFPLGKSMSPDGRSNPSISVNRANVSTLRRKDGKLVRIEMDAGLTFGHSGAPVLGPDGKVLGVVVSGVLTGRISQAIPASHLTAFLAAPDFRFTPEPLTGADLDRAVTFTLEVIPLLPGKPVSVDLLLGVGEAKERRLAMKSKDSVFTASTVPAPAKDRKVELTARFGSASVTGFVADQPVQAAGRALRLSALRRIEFLAKPMVTLADGKTTLTGPVTGLDKVEVHLGDQPITLNLTRATTIAIVGPVAIAQLTCTFVASRDGKEIGRFRAIVPVRQGSRTRPADVSTVKITPPALEDDKVIKKLPEVFADVAVGGGGRYFIFHLPRLRKLAVFDINQARVIGYIPVKEDKVRFAAGLDKLVVALPGSATLERWTLDGLKCESTVFPDLKGEIKSVIMGSASNGPVAVNGVFMDLQTLKPLTLDYQSSWGTATRIVPSGDGAVFGAWNTNLSPGTATAFILEGNKVKRYDEGTLGHVVPGPDGKMLYTAKGPVTRRFARSAAGDDKLGYCLPAVRGNYFVSLSTAEGSSGGGATIYLQGHQRPVARLEKMGHGLRFDGWDREEFGAWRRFFLVPQANVIVILPPSNDRLVLHKFDVEKALETSGVDYLLVTSQPPVVARRGTTYQYQLAVKSKKGGVKYRLDAGPKGMDVSMTGLVKWLVPAEGKETEADVILTVSDRAGQEVFHTFTVAIQK